MNFRKLSFQDCCHCWEVLHPALGPQKRKLSNTFVLTDFSSGPQFTEKPAYRPSLELDQWDKEERSCLFNWLWVCDKWEEPLRMQHGCFISHCSMFEYHSYLRLCRDCFTNGTCLKAFLEKKANNVHCQAAKQPLKRHSTLITLFERKRELDFNYYSESLT